MNTLHHIGLVLILAAVMPLSAQVVLEPEDIPDDPETTFMYYNFSSEDGIEIDLGEAGEDQVWDYTHLMFPDINDDLIIDPDEAQFIDEFEDANRVLRSYDSGFGLEIDNGFRYEELGNNSWDLLGVELSEDQDLGVPIEYVQFPDPLRILPMPAEIGEDWDIETTLTLTIEAPDSLADIFDSLDVTINIEGTGEIDAWGSLLFPSDVVEALRVHITGSGNITAAGVRHIFGRRIVVDLGEVDSIPTTHTYKWYSPGLGEILTVTSLPDEEEENFELASKIRMRLLDDIEHYAGLNRSHVLHRLIVTGVQQNDDQVPDGWEIGIFTPQDVLAGTGVWHDNEQIGIPVYANDPDTEEIIEGFLDQAAFTFKIWDNENDEEWQADAVFEEGPEIWTEDGLTILSLVGTALETVTEKIIPGSWFLSRAYPNPFNSSTRLEFGLREEGNVKVSIFDGTGREITVLADGIMSVGVHQLEWHANGLSTGTYFVEMKSGGFEDIQRIMLVK